MLTFANGIGLAMRWPVYSAIVPELVPRSQLPSALALNGVGMNASRIVGPIVAGMLIAGAGTAWVLVLNAVLSIGRDADHKIVEVASAQAGVHTLESFVICLLPDELSQSAAEQIATYLAEGKRSLGTVPTMDTVALERFFDESGGMQLVLHAPFGSRIN